MLNTSSVERAKILIKEIAVENAVIDLENKIENDIKESLDNEQREYFLKEKIRVIRGELGEKVTGNVGGDLNIESKQDKKHYEILFGQRVERDEQQEYKHGNFDVVSARKREHNGKHRVNERKKRGNRVGSVLLRKVVNHHDGCAF